MVVSLIQISGDSTVSVKVDEGFIAVNESKVFLMCGEIHYFRTPKGQWYDILVKAKRGGLNCVSSYIPWNWHEITEGKVILDSDTEAESPYESKIFSRNLVKYLETIKNLNMFFIARPGPYICSEWDSGGHPNRLYKVTSMFRSLDSVYIKEVVEWYKHVLSTLARYTISKGGPVIMLQVENEYFWGDVNYIMKLYDIAKNFINDIPIITNENWHVVETDIINTIDEYPIPWDIKGFDKKIQSYVKNQQNKLKMFMELEGGWFTSFGSTYPTSRGTIPSEWTEILLKTSLGLGINAINIYMFYGGTNPGYYTGKYITTSYDYEAAIREWGELSKRYYVIKRFAYFVKTFNDLIVESKPSEKVFEVYNDHVEVFSRTTDNSEGILILRNLTLEPQLTTIKLRDSSHPQGVSVVVPPRSAKILLVNHKLKGTPFKIVLTSSEPLLKIKVGTETVVILYGDIQEVGETIIESEDPLNIVYSNTNIVIEKISSTVIALRYTISCIDSVVVLESKDHTLYLIITCKSRAERTWIIDDIDPPLIILSNIYFIGKIIKADGNNIVLECEFDRYSYGDVLIISFRRVDGVRLEGDNIPLKHIYKSLYILHLSNVDEPQIPNISITNKWFIKFEDPPKDFMPIVPREPLEQNGFYDNGYYIYRIDFSVNKEELKKLNNSIIFMSSFNDYATVFLNGIKIGSGYHSLEMDAANALREGMNTLLILLESTGHTADGIVYVPNGITGHIYIGKVSEERLTQWSFINIVLKYGKEFSMSKFINSPLEILDALNNIDKSSNTEVVATTLDRQGLYVTKLCVDLSNGNRFIIDLGKYTYLKTYYFYPRALIFVNKRFLGAYRGPIDITDYLVNGCNDLAIFIEWTASPLQPVLIVYQRIVDGNWYVKRFTSGLEMKWFDKNVIETGWREVRIPLTIEPYSALIWLRSRVHIDINDKVVAPLKLVIKARGVRALIFFNGNLIGRYTEEGPQEEFYIPEPLIATGENTISIALHVTQNKGYIDYVGIEPYYTHITKTLSITFERHS